MRTPVRALSLALLLLPTVVSAPPAAWAGDFIDTRISFTLGDDNFFKDAGQQVPDSPRIGIGDRPGYELPFDNLISDPRNAQRVLAGRYLVQNEPTVAVRERSESAFYHLDVGARYGIAATLILQDSAHPGLSA